MNRNPEESASKVFTGTQAAFFIGFIFALGAFIYFDRQIALLSVFFIAQVIFAAPVLFKLVMAIIGLIKRVSIMKDYTVPGKDNDLPIYTILVAAYKEEKVIGSLITCMKKINYPKNKLDIILLLEKGDTDTLRAAKAEKPPASWRFLTCPDSVLHTKSSALNYGLNFARGEYLTVYDAEDLPEPDQLKKAVAAFRNQSDDYICFQASLNYFNKNENFLTKLFTLENSSWFDCLLPGLSSLGLPIPLGRTSNHFDVKKLRKIGAWDPFNVTEEADLGIRASMKGYKVGIIDSTTYEEANSRLSNWVRQRSRWVKGYLQTFLVHSRHPFASLQNMGFIKWLSYFLLIGGTPVNFILNPVMWVLFTLSILLNVTGLFHVPSALVYLAGFNLIVSNTLVIITSMLGVLPRKDYKLILYALFSPAYWMLQSFAAYKGLWQLFTKPFYWEKTDHGITENIPVSRTLHIPDDISELVVIKEHGK
jgi:glycosyltransferase XagB